MTYTIDPAHSTLGFTVRHMMIAKVRGSFTDYEATAELNADDLTKSRVEATIAVASIDTGQADRDQHLRSADFFDAEAHPTMRFVSTSIEDRGDGRYALHGDLTIKDATKPITLDVEATGPAKDPWGNTRFGFSLTGALDRDAFGLTWNQALETGGVLVGNEVKLEAEIQVMRAPAEAGAPATT